MKTVIFSLRMNFGVAIDLAGRGLQNPRFDSLCQAQHVDGAVNAGLGCLHRVVLIVHGRCRAGEIENAVDLDIQRKGDVVAHQFKARITQKMGNVSFVAGEEVVYTQDIVVIRDEAVAQV